MLGFDPWPYIRLKKGGMRWFGIRSNTLLSWHEHTKLQCVDVRGEVTAGLRNRRTRISIFLCWAGALESPLCINECPIARIRVSWCNGLCIHLHNWKVFKRIFYVFWSQSLSRANHFHVEIYSWFSPFFKRTAGWLQTYLGGLFVIWWFIQKLFTRSQFFICCFSWKLETAHCRLSEVIRSRGLKRIIAVESLRRVLSKPSALKKEEQPSSAIFQQTLIHTQITAHKTELLQFSSWRRICLTQLTLFWNTSSRIILEFLRWK